MNWTTIICREPVWEKEPSLASWASSCKKIHTLVLPEKTPVEEVLNATQILPEEVLLVTESREDWEKASRRQIAVLPYRDPNNQPPATFPAAFPGTATPKAATPEVTFPGAWMVAEGLDDVDEEFFLQVYLREHGLPWTPITTERCYLRELTMEDLDALFALYEGDGITDYLEPLYPREEEEAYQRGYIDNIYRYYGYGMWLVCKKTSGEIIGRAGLEHRDYGNGAELEMGYLIAAGEQRKGYATEVCRALIAFAEEMPEFERINCLIHRDNKVSLHLMDKLGFTFLEERIEGEKPMLRYVKNLRTAT